MSKLRPVARDQSLELSAEDVLTNLLIVCSTLMALIITTAGAQAQGCTRDHELYRIVPEHRAIMLDGGDIKRVMFVDWKDERLNLWKPGHNITYCPDENKMINTTIIPLRRCFLSSLLHAKRS